MVLISIGSAGLAVAKAFTSTKMIIPIVQESFPKHCESPEDFEKHWCDTKLQISFDEEECWVILCGASRVAGCTLRALETIKHKKINIIYICPDTSLLAPVQAKSHKVVFNILQEYTRSGLLNRMYLFSNVEILKIIGAQSITQMYTAINNQIVNSLETIWYFQSQSPVLGQIHKPKDISRICTVSIGDFKKNEEKSLFLLDNCTETWYIYSINKTQLKSNKDLLNLIKSRVFAEDNQTIASFAIYPSAHKQSFFYSLKLTHYIQTLEV
tara:strand:+ start:423 stop:1229 length:807 start_codon:yes stop_codon:yes gene_type:complete